MKIDGSTKKEILRSLKERNKTLSEISRELGISKSSIHRHLRNLRELGLVDRITNGNKFIYYRLTEKGKEALDLIASLIAAIISALVSYFAIKDTGMLFAQTKKLAYADHIPNPFVPSYHAYSTDIRVAAALSFIFVFIIVFFLIKLIREV